MARLGLASAVSVVLLVGCATAPDAGEAPRLDGLPIGVWTQVPLAGDAVCADGSPYAAQVRRGDGDDLVVAFQGGGATWGVIDGVPSLLGPLLGGLYRPSVASVGSSGLAAPPPGAELASATQVLVSYCSGDIHWGDAAGVDAAGEAVTQRGAANVRAVLGWLDEQEVAPAQLTIVGCSAGAYGALLWAPSLQARFPAARRSLLLDGGLGVVQDPFVTGESGLASWNVVGAFAENGLSEPDGLDYFERLVADVALRFDGPLGIASTDRDVVQAAFWYLMGDERNGFRVDDDVDAWSDEAMGRIGRLAEIDGVSTFVSDWQRSRLGTTGHCITEHDDLWGDGIGAAFTAWWAELRAGVVPESVDARE